MRLQGLVLLLGAIGAGCGDIDHPPRLDDSNAPQPALTETPTMRSDPPSNAAPGPAPPPVPGAPQPDGGSVPLGGGLLGVPPEVEGSGGQPGSGSGGGIATPSGTVSPDEGVFEGPGVAVDVDEGEISERDGGAG